MATAEQEVLGSETSDGGSASHENPDVQSEANGSAEDHQVGSAVSVGGWEVGSIMCGVVSYWNRERGWGKIKRLQKGQLHPKRPPRKNWHQEIFVHNTQLPMDARRRWLRRGERVQFTVALGVRIFAP